MKFNLNAESINYLKITCTDDNGFAHYIKAAIRYIGESEVLAAVKKEEDVSISFPQDVDLGIACDNGLYTAKTELKKVEEEPLYKLFLLKRPENFEYQQKREYFRVKLQEDVNIVYEFNGTEKSYSAVTYDISANGVRIELDDDINFPENVKLMLILPGRNIISLAKYIRNDDEDQINKASFQFVEISQSDIDYISQFCLQRQLEERRKNLL